MPAPPVDLRAEALLYAEWMRAALGRFAAGDGTEPGGRLLASEGVPATRSPPDAAHVRGVGGGGREPTPPSSETTGDRNIEVIRPKVALSASQVDLAGYEALRETALACKKCRLCESRTQVVFGEGTLHPRLMVIGEAPGAEEDASGRPFIGKAGQLLTRMLAAIGLGRDDVYIANVLKCRPPDNRPPTPDEILACRPYLREQIERLSPELLLLLGNHATRAVLATDRGITSLRGNLIQSPEGWRTLPTYHPAYLLRNPDAKREAWADLQLAASTLGLPVPGRPAG